MNHNLLVTGASSDIGIAFLRKIYKSCDVIFLQYRTMNSSLEELVMQIRKDNCELVLLQADLNNEDDVESFIEKIKCDGRMPNEIVHLAMPCAYNKQFHKDSLERWDIAWQVAIRSIVQMLQVFLPEMSKGRYGRIIFMLTSYTRGMPPKFQSGYVTTKYALLGLMKSIAVEYADRGITCNGVSPEMMETKFLKNIPDLIVEQNALNSPLGRNVLVQEILPILEYMLSENGGAMNGENVGITAGKA